MRSFFGIDSRLYAITDTQTTGLSHTRMTRTLLGEGIRIIQMREKSLSRMDIYNEAAAIADLAKSRGAVFILNDYVDIALAAGADGVHLGQEDMPVEIARKIMGKRKIIGVSTHSLSQAKRAQEAGADYIGFGPIYLTETKDAGYPKGIRKLREIKRYINIPVVAIGGITWENADDVISSGADAVAVISGVLRGNIRANARRLSCALGEHV